MILGCYPEYFFVWRLPRVFNTAHVLYMLISAAATAALLTVLCIYVKDQKQKLLVIKISAVATVAIHYSSLWVDFFAEGEAMVEKSMLFPIYPCNICMWLFLIAAFVRPNSKIFRYLAEFLMLAGVTCAVIGIVFNENYGGNPTLTDYDILKGLLSHSTMLFGCLYLGVSGLATPRMHCLLSVVSGLLFFVADGLIINALFSVFDLEEVNSMYLLSPPFENLPFINTLTIGIAAVAVTFSIASIYEYFCVAKEDRWYKTLARYINKPKLGSH